MADGIKKISENVTIPKRALVVTDPNVADNDAIEIGALQSDPANKGLKIKTSKGVYSLLDAAAMIMPGTIITNLLADLSVTTAKLADKSVTEPKLADVAVSTRTIINEAVTEAKLGPKSVTETKIGDSAIVNRHYSDLSITNAKIADNTIENRKLFDKTITDKKIADGAIVSSLIQTGAIINRHLSNECITNNNFSAGSIYGNAIKDKGVEQRHLADNAVNTNNIMNGAVTDVKLADKCIKQNHLAENAVTTPSIEDLSVTKNKLATDCVSSDKIINKSITKEKLSDELIDMIGDPVQYDQNNDVTLRKHLTVNGNITATGTIQGNVVLNSVFMDLAEAYVPAERQTFVPGDIVQVNTEGKLEKADMNHVIHNYPIVGVVSDEYAACYGATEEELKNGDKIPVGLIGKVHVNVLGPVNLGDKIAFCKNGAGASMEVNNVTKADVIGKALETNEENGLKKVLCLIYPN